MSYSWPPPPEVIKRRSIEAIQRNDQAYNHTMPSLFGKELNDEEVQEIAQALHYNTTLQTLVVAKHNICDRGAEALAQALCSREAYGGRGGGNTTLKGIHLSLNNVTERGAMALAYALGEGGNRTLETLALDGNTIGDAGAKAFGHALGRGGNRILQSLGLSATGVTNVGVRQLGDGIRINTGLQTISLDFNKITDAGAQDFLDAIRGNTELTDIKLLERNPINDNHIINAISSRIEQRKKKPANVGTEGASVATGFPNASQRGVREMEILDSEEIDYCFVKKELESHNLPMNFKFIRRVNGCAEKYRHAANSSEAQEIQPLFHGTPCSHRATKICLEGFDVTEKRGSEPTEEVVWLAKNPARHPYNYLKPTGSLLCLKGIFTKVQTEFVQGGDVYKFKDADHVLPMLIVDYEFPKDEDTEFLLAKQRFERQNQSKAVSALKSRQLTNSAAMRLFTNVNSLESKSSPLGVRSTCLTLDDAKLVLAHAAIWSAGGKLYGGFVRDWVIRREASNDIDVGLDKRKWDTATKQIIEKAKSFGINFHTTKSKGQAHTLIFSWNDSVIDVDLTDPRLVPYTSPGVSADVDNVMINEKGMLCRKVDKSNLLPLATAIQHILEKKFVNYRNIEDEKEEKRKMVNQRIEKLLRKGFTLVSPLPKKFQRDLEKKYPGLVQPQTEFDKKWWE